MSGGNQKTILLVEDEILIALSEKMTLERYQYNVITVNTGEKAIEIIEKNPDINLILMDIDLGKGIDGTQAAEIILKDRDIPVVFLSSHAEPEIVEKTEKITSYGYVVKSSSNTVLDASIKMAFKLFDSMMKTKEKEEALQKSSETTEKYLNVVAEIIISLDTHGTITLLNDSGHKLLGWETGELVGKNWFDVCLPMENQSEVRNVFNILMSGNIENVANYENTVVTKSGKVKIISWHNVILTDNHGTITGLLSSGQDITEHNRVQAALFESDVRYRSFVEHSSEGIYRIEIAPPVSIDLPPDELIRIINERAVVTEVNNALANMYSLSPDQMIGRLAIDFAPNYGKRAILVLQNQKHQVVNEETIDTDREGRPIFLEESYHGEVIDGQLVRIWGVQRNITERKLTENELKKKTRELNLIFDTVPAMIWQKDEHGKYLQVNKTYCDIVGISKENILGKTDYDLYPQEIADIYVNDDKKVLHTGNPLKGIEERHKKKSGEYGWSLTHKQIVNSIEGELVGTMGFALDITKRKQIKKSLEDNESLLRNIIDSSTDYIFVKDTNLRTILCNKAFAKTFGKQPSEFIGKTDIENGWDAELVEGNPEKGIRGYKHDDLDALSGKIVQNVDKAFISGEIHFFDSIKVPIKNESGEIFGILGISRDVTDRKRIDEKIQKNEELLRIITETIQDAIFAKNINREYIFVNPAAVKILGLPIENIIGKKAEDIFTLENCQKIKEVDDINFQGKAVDQIKSLTIGGEEIYFQTTQSPIYNVNNEIIGIAGVVKNITEIVKTDEKINQLLKEKELLLKEIHHSK